MTAGTIWGKGINNLFSEARGRVLVQHLVIGFALLLFSSFRIKAVNSLIIQGLQLVHGHGLGLGGRGQLRGQSQPAKSVARRGVSLSVTEILVGRKFMSRVIVFCITDPL